MILVLSSNVSEGLVPAERIARVQDADGRFEEVSVSIKDIKDDKLIASEIGRVPGKVLVELPRESASGRWRVWVKDTEVAV